MTMEVFWVSFRFHVHCITPTKFSIIFSPCSVQGIVKRDEIVFRAARRRSIPILMVTSGGYQKKTARIIADSILNLRREGLIDGAPPDGAGPSLMPLMMSKSVSAGATFNAI